MELTKLLKSDDNRAVSPVIGVILMVAITVILAAVIGTFVLGLGDQVRDTAPNAQFSWDQSEPSSGQYTATVTMGGGQSIQTDNVNVVLDATQSNVGDTVDVTTWPSSGSEVVAGDSMTIGNDANGEYLEPEDEIRINWVSSDGGTSSTLTQYEVN
jgi:flagellin-like protein